MCYADVTLRVLSQCQRIRSVTGSIEIHGGVCCQRPCSVTSALMSKLVRVSYLQRFVRRILVVMPLTPRQQSTHDVAPTRPQDTMHIKLSALSSADFTSSFCRNARTEFVGHFANSSRAMTKTMYDATAIFDRFLNRILDLVHSLKQGSRSVEVDALIRYSKTV